MLKLMLRALFGTLGSRQSLLIENADRWHEIGVLKRNGLHLGARRHRYSARTELQDSDSVVMAFSPPGIWISPS
jgi:hypothetical protein